MERACVSVRRCIWKQVMSTWRRGTFYCGTPKIIRKEWFRFPTPLEQLCDSTVLTGRKFSAPIPSIFLPTPEMLAGVREQPMNSFGGFWCGHKFRIQKKVLGFTIFGIHFPFIHLQRCHPRDWIYITLPILSKYLGHASLEATDRYVRLTAEMYPELLQQANQLCAYVFPEVIQDGV